MVAAFLRLLAPLVVLGFWLAPLEVAASHPTTPGCQSDSGHTLSAPATPITAPAQLRQARPLQVVVGVFGAIHPRPHRFTPAPPAWAQRVPDPPTRLRTHRPLYRVLRSGQAHRSAP